MVPRSEPTSPASSLGEAVTSTLNSSVTSAPCPMPNSTRPNRTGTALQSLRTTKASHSSATVQRMKPIAPDLPGREPVVEPDDQHRREEHREVERHHGDRSGERRAALHDLDIERHREIERGLQRDDGEHRVDRGPLLRRIDHLERKQRRLSCGLPSVRPHQEGLAEHDAHHDHDRRGRQAEEVERRVGSRQPQAPPVQVVEAEADEDDGGRRQNDADHVDLHIRAPLIGLEAEAQKENDGRDGDQNSEGRAPADIGAQNAADHERQHAGAGARRAQRAQRRRLLRPL